MDHESLSTFLSITKHGNIAKAANELFISQGTASTRIQHLEKDLGVQLFYRQRGVRKLSLTPEGEALLPIAQQCAALWQDAYHLKNIQFFKELRIAAIDMLNTFLFSDIYKKFMNTHKKIILTIQTEHSTEIHQLIENQLMDIGFVFSLHMFPNIISKPLYREDMVFLHHKEAHFAFSKNIKDLKEEDEIYLRWSTEFNLWHNHYFNFTNRRKITLGTVSMLPNFLGDEKSWTIVSRSIADIMITKIPELCASDIDNPPPQRTAYILFHKYPKAGIKEELQIFLNEVINYIRKRTSITLLYKE
ncbi:LysR family transcriptional regulator [Paenibacillus kribbensis]|uniref:LysR family transcriptional regulator n=1 Tax=Paenibacillus kribbensis TaxID=172713 RepID=UPI000838F79F|nr:LysR family transcriptional regulator [Paenibacillus kribbensis]